MDTNIKEIAQRICSLREILEISQEEMAEITDSTLVEYQKAENGETDFSFTFLHKCSQKFDVDIVELLTGENPRLSLFSIVRAGQGLPIRRREGFNYNHLGYRIKDKKAEPFLVRAPYIESEQSASIKLSSHKGQEFDYIVEGSLKVQIGETIEVLHTGDSIYYDSNLKHGMIATNGAECTFLAIIMAE